MQKTEIIPGRLSRLFRGIFVVAAILAMAMTLCVSDGALAAGRSGSLVASQPPKPGPSPTPTKKRKKHSRARREPSQKAPTADRIEEIQSALSREGYYKRDPSKKWDSDTQEAMRRFQEDHGLTGTGKLDAPTLQKLGLGSDIAGVSAPHPPQPSADSPAPSSAPATTPSATTFTSQTANAKPQN
ncbi:MAG: peptidoglycan-binding domain-containing protein [Candidatus Acidiferrales bacterium]